MSNQEAIEVMMNIAECHTRKKCDLECENCPCNFSDDELQEALELGAKALKGEKNG